MERDSKHHRKPRSKGGKTTPENISIVNATQHKAWHTLFFNLDPGEICKIINDTWLDLEFKFTCKKRRKK